MNLGFPVPKPIPLMPLPFQVAQKLHGVSASGSNRVRDLIDLQVIFAHDDVSLRVLRETCERLFRYRQCQPWPPLIVKGKGWDELYAAQRGSLPVALTVDKAIAWTNALVEKIDATV